MPPRVKQQPLFTILGLDPGTNSFAYCVLDVYPPSRTCPLKAVVRQHGMINATMRTLNNPALLQAERASFKACLDTVLGLGVTHVIAERYMLRRGSGGTAIEAINLMLGILLERNLPTKYIPASQWKNALRRLGIDLESIYAEVKQHKVTPHQTDATHIAYFGANALLGNKVGVYKDIAKSLAGLQGEALGLSTKPKPKKRKKRKLAAGAAAKRKAKK